MAEDRRLPVSSSLRLHPDEVGRRTFATARRGFDPTEVRAYLEHVALQLAAAEQREQELRDLLAEAEQRAQNPVLDEETLTTALGQETARVLRSAHEVAADLIGRAEADASRSVTEAQEEAGKLQAMADQHASDRAAQSEAAAAETRQRANDDAAAKLEAARVEADMLIEQARVECRAMLSEAQELRARVLGDLSRRRRVLHSQIEQLRAGRDRLAETIGGVREAVDRVTDELFRAEDEARIAAEAAARHAAVQAEAPGTDQLGAREEPVSHAEQVLAHAPGSAAPGSAVSESVASESSVPESSAPRSAAPGQVTAEANRSEADEHAGASLSDQSVEELFARLRAERGELGSAGSDETVSLSQRSAPPSQGSAYPAEVVESAPQSSAGPSEKATRVLDGNVADHSTVSRGERKRGTASRRRSEEPLSEARVPAAASGRGTEPQHGPELGEMVGPDHGEGPGNLTPDADGGQAREPLLVQRDDVLGPVTATLARRLKRALTDDQNDILDRLRGGKSHIADVLALEGEQVERYESAGREQLVEAARAGTAFGGGRSANAPSIDDIARDLANSIVVPLRRRLEGEGGQIELGDDAAVVEHVGAAFRDWKGERVERLAGDEAIAAFSRGALQAAAPGVSLRWVFDDDGADCPDCDDNSLAGPVPPGELFPTGHVHPPAHAGCRCLLAPADA